MTTLVDIDKLVFKPPEPGCALYLPGLPGGGNKIYDKSPYSNNGTITGATWKRLPSGLWYLSFDGTDDVVSCGRNSSLLILGDLTLECWAKFDDYDSWYLIIGQFLGNYCGVYSLLIMKTTGLARLYRGNGVNLQDIVESISAVGHDWTHIVGTMSGTSAIIYFNGEEDNTDTIDTTIADDGNDILLGRSSLGYSDGGIASPRIYNRALSALEIQNHFNQEKHLFGVW